MESIVDEIINPSVYKTGCRYLEGAKELMQSNDEHFLPAFVLAAFAAEIFLKSFIVKRKKITGTINFPEIGEANCHSYKNVFFKFKGHTLSDIYKQIEQTSKTLLLNEISMSEQDFLFSISRYENYFNGLRYFYEEGSINRSDSGVIELAQKLEQACKNIWQKSK